METLVTTESTARLATNVGMGNVQELPSASFVRSATVPLASVIMTMERSARMQINVHYRTCASAVAARAVPVRIAGSVKRATPLREIALLLRIVGELNQVKDVNLLPLISIRPLMERSSNVVIT
jgi:hypothetical protein